MVMWIDYVGVGGVRDEWDCVGGAVSGRWESELKVEG